MSPKSKRVRKRRLSPDTECWEFLALKGYDLWHSPAREVWEVIFLAESGDCELMGSGETPRAAVDQARKPRNPRRRALPRRRAKLSPGPTAGQMCRTRTEPASGRVTAARPIAPFGSGSIVKGSGEQR